MPSPKSASTSRLAPPAPLSALNSSLLLDFDGTLVDLVDRPEAVVADLALKALLARLAGTFEGRIALVSGRSIVQLFDFFGNALPRFGFVGSHGAEVQVGVQRVAPVRPAALDAVEQAMRSAFAQEEGIIVEPKSLGVALHYRLAPTAETKVRSFASELAAASGLMIQEGKMMIELRASGHDKGTGIVDLMAQSPFFGTRPIFIGDDLTDEAGFAAAERFGGFGVLVGAERATAARYRLSDVAAVRNWLGEAA
ncbi:trehalose-phosphatase [Sphingopyxis sp.]|jgi:trehalose 6-phosphate phosphatase|uniref:trehalose-phosphatase n=1 Tax=Sphingopyxis sp. TaxID=1908224 RepID=UPI0025FBBA96|nr:trehalose-phosphatase [Sphingopyxis sp.]MBK6413892.1 trehalose-phosphatase [Sphingopyxis sp.]